MGLGRRPLFLPIVQVSQCHTLFTLKSFQTKHKYIWNKKNHHVKTKKVTKCPTVKQTSLQCYIGTRISLVSHYKHSQYWLYLNPDIIKLFLFAVQIKNQPSAFSHRSQAHENVSLLLYFESQAATGLWN